MAGQLGAGGFEPRTNPAERRDFFDLRRQITEINARLDTAEGELDLVNLGAWTSWTPQIAQNGNRSSTNNGSVYAKVGRTVHIMVNVTLSATGTANNAVTVSLPVAAASTNWAWFGQGSVYDSSVLTDYPALGFLASTTTFYLRSSSNASILGATGAVFTAALASGDIIRFSGTYEAAA